MSIISDNMAWYADENQAQRKYIEGDYIVKESTLRLIRGKCKI